MTTDTDGIRFASKVHSQTGREIILGNQDIAEVFPHAALDASFWRYYVAATATNPRDVSTIERDQQTGELMAALVASHNSEGVGYFGRAATFEIAAGVPSDAIPSVGRATAETLCSTVEVVERGLSARVIADSAVLSGFERVLLGSGASSSLEFSGEVNLTLSEEKLWRSLRKSYRSLVNMGRREVTIELVHQAAHARERFDLYRALHLEVAGRVTRPALSWDVMYEMVAAGQAQLLLAHLEGRPIAATYLMRFGTLALYASGAYVRDLGKFPVSHWPLFASMLEAKRSGIERLIMGSVFLDSDGNATPKEQSIASFKLGFSTEVRVRRYYRLGREVASDFEIPLHLAERSQSDGS